MTERNSLQSKGYDPQTKNQGMGWQCDIAVNGAIKSFRASSEREAVRRAAEFVKRLEGF